jgi:hypothetical protein
LAGEYFEIKIQSGPESDNLFATKRKVYLVFFVDGNQTAISDIFTIIPGETLTKEYSFDGQKNKEAQLRDADTKQVLDQVTVTQNSDRDLGGL